MSVRIASVSVAFSLALAPLGTACSSSADPGPTSAEIVSGAGGGGFVGGGGYLGTGGSAAGHSGYSGGSPVGAGGAPSGSGGAVATGTGGSPSGGGAVTLSAGGVSGAGGGGGPAGSCEGRVIATAPGTSMDCATCMCTNCADAESAMKDDQKAKDLFLCGQHENCNGECCFCGGAPCDLLGSNYRKGPCNDVVELAAGVPVPSNYFIDGLNLKALCETAGNTCNKPRVLAACIQQKCAAVCPKVPTCP